MFSVSEDNFFNEKKNRIFETQQPYNSSGDCVRFWEGRLWLRQGGWVYDIMMLMVEAVGVDGVGRVEGLGGGGKCERNGRQRDDHR